MHREGRPPNLDDALWADLEVLAGLDEVGRALALVAEGFRRVMGDRPDPVDIVADRAEAELQKTGATWIATTDYRTYAMMRWYFKDRAPVIQINERGRFMGFRDPGMDRIRGHAGVYVVREPDRDNPIWDVTTAVREPLEQVNRVWRGRVMDTYVLQKVTGWTPELSPPPDAPLFRWRVLAGDVRIETGCAMPVEVG